MFFGPGIVLGNFHGEISEMNVFV